MVANEGHHAPFAPGIVSWSRERPRREKVAFGGRIASNGFGGTAGGVLPISFELLAGTLFSSLAVASENGRSFPGP